MIVFSIGSTYAVVLTDKEEGNPPLFTNSPIFKLLVKHMSE